MADEFITLNYEEQFVNADQALERFGEECVQRLQVAVDEGADDVVRRAQSLAPRRTGALRESIHKEEEGPLNIIVVADAPYAVYVEFGTSTAPAQPFLTPAAEGARPGIISRIVSTIRETVGNAQA